MHAVIELGGGLHKFNLQGSSDTHLLLRFTVAPKQCMLCRFEIQNKLQGGKMEGTPRSPKGL
jgi:hypothetical protein